MRARGHAAIVVLVIVLTAGGGYAIWLKSAEPTLVLLMTRVESPPQDGRAPLDLGEDELGRLPQKVAAAIEGAARSGEAQVELNADEERRYFAALGDRAAEGRGLTFRYQDHWIVVGALSP